METLAYLHHATAYDSPDLDTELIPLELNLFQALKWQKLSSTAVFSLLSIAVSLPLLMGSSALALSRGSRGPAVIDLQTRLSAAGYYNGPITGYYGRLTEAAVKNFQKARRLKQIGVAGPQTYATLRRVEGISARTPASKPNTTRVASNRRNLVASRISSCYSSTVAAVQRNLIAKGYNPGRVDGINGPRTQAAIRKFQRDNGLVADGIVGSATLSALT